MNSEAKRLILLVALFIANSVHSADSLFLDKGEVVINEEFSAGRIDVGIWQSARKPAGQRVEKGFYHYDCSESKDRLKRIGMGHVFDKPVEDLILELKFTATNGFKSMNIGFNDEQGHCLVNRLEKDKIYFYKYKEKNKHSFFEYLDIAGSGLKDGQEYTVTVEISGSNVFVHIDDKHFLIGQHERFKNPKTRIFFAFHGGQGKVDSVKIWQGNAVSNPDTSKWLAKKDQRMPVNLDLDKAFKKRKLLADARVSLMEDDEYLRLLKATEEKWQGIRKKYKYFKNYAFRKKEKEARESNEEYNALLKEFAALEKAELEYVYKNIKI